MKGIPSHQDHLSEVLETFPLNLCFAGRFELSAPWGIHVPEGVALICTVIEGYCHLTAEDEQDEISPIPGDLFLLSPGAEHRLCDSPKTPVLPPSRWMTAIRADGPLVLTFGDGATRNVWLGGVLQFDDPKVHPFYWGLPPVVHLSEQTIGEAGRIKGLLRLIENELSVDLPGRRSIVNRLIEVLLVETARYGLAAADDSREGSPGRLLHPELGPALALMHRQPGKPWTVAELAEHVAMSRSAFAAEFVKVLGQPPLHYLRERRMQLAGRLLHNPSLGLKEVALRVGYDSVSAFNSAFKQRWGIAPGRFRNVRSTCQTTTPVSVLSE